MRETSQAALIYFSIILLIAFALFITKNANCLFALLLLPSLKAENQDTEDQEETE